MCLSNCIIPSFVSLFFFCNDTATTEIYTLSLHDALPIYVPRAPLGGGAGPRDVRRVPCEPAPPRAGRRSADRQTVPPLPAAGRGGSGRGRARGPWADRGAGVRPALPSSGRAGPQDLLDRKRAVGRAPRRDRRPLRQPRRPVLALAGACGDRATLRGDARDRPVLRRCRGKRL